MALPATDVFTGTDGTQLTTYSANWAINSGDFHIQSNAVSPDSVTTECGARWDADSFDADQYSQAVIAAIGGTGDPENVGVGVRHAAGGTASFYGLYCVTALGFVGLYLFKMVANTWTQLGSIGTNPVANDVLRLEVSGTTLTPKINGSAVSPPGAQTDSALASGAAGLTGYHSGAANRVDTWEGDNLAGAAAPPRRRPFVIGGGVF